MSILCSDYQDYRGSSNSGVGPHGRRWIWQYAWIHLLETESETESETHDCAIASKNAWRQGWVKDIEICRKCFSLTDIEQFKWSFSEKFYSTTPHLPHFRPRSTGQPACVVSMSHSPEGFWLYQKAAAYWNSWTFMTYKHIKLLKVSELQSSEILPRLNCVNRANVVLRAFVIRRGRIP